MISVSGDRFALLRQVGAGAFGVVYEGRDALDGSKVAVKLLQGLSSVDDGRFAREASLLAELRHPNIVRYVAHGQTGAGQNYLVMEWLDGHSLDVALRAGPLSIAEVVALARGVVAGLMAAERSGTVHRDIKPANLFLVSGSAERAKILDFGLARRLSEAQSLTQVGAAIGTPLYMSPEQARGDRGLDPRSDVFSLGSVLYECLCGSSPFEGSSALATLAKICLHDPPPLDGLRPGLPARLTALVHAMLHKEPGARPTYGELSAGLEQVALGEPDGTQSRGRVRLSASEWSAQPSPKPGARPRVLCSVLVGKTDPLEGGHSEALAASAIADAEREFSAKLAAVLSTYHARCTRLLDGSRVLLMDGPLAPDEQAAAAAQCALAIHQLAPRASLVVCMGKAVLDGSQPLGELMTRAALLLGKTALGTIRVDDDAAALLEVRFEIEGGDGQRQLRRERSGGEAPRTLLGQTTPFVGREGQLAELERTLRKCIEERVARAVLVMSPAGGGKSRLRYEFVERCRREGKSFTLLIARGDSMRAATPFAALAPALRAWCEITSGDVLELKREKLRTRVARLFPTERVQSVADFLGELMGVPFPDEASPHLLAARRDPQLMADRVLATWLEWLEAECTTRPVLLCLEDLQWSDGASVRFIEAALRNMDAQPLMVLAFARPELAEKLPNLWAEHGVTKLDLPKLRPAECEHLLAAIGQTDEAARARLIERADGNPFFLEELVRGAGAQGDRQSLPDSILGMVQARLDTLADEAKLLIRVASVFGQVFSIEAVRALLGLDAFRIDVMGWLRVLCEREVIFPKGEASEAEYVFRHALIRDAAYLLLADNERKVGHRMAGEWLERNGTTEPALLADHFEQGGALAQAARWYKVASARAFEASSLEDVLRLGERAVECGAEGEALGEVASIVAAAMSYNGDDATEWAQAAWESLTPGTPAWWRAAQVLAIAHLRSSSPAVLAVAEQMVARTLEGAPLQAPQVSAMSYVAAASLQSLQRDIGLRLLQRLPEQLPSALSGRPEGCMYLARAMLYFFDGRPSTAIEQARRSLNAFRSAGAGRDIAELLHVTGWMLCGAGAHEEAESCFLELVQLARRVGGGRLLASGLEHLGIIYLRWGRLEEAERMLAACAEEWGRTMFAGNQGITLFHLARVVARRGELARASGLIGKSLALVAGEPIALAGALAAQAEIELLQGRPAEARLAAEQAMDLVKTNQLVEYVAMARVAHIESLVACGRLEEARSASAEALSWLHEQAERIDDPGIRHSFLTLIPENARVHQLGESLAAS